MKTHTQALIHSLHIHVTHKLVDINYINIYIYINTYKISSSLPSLCEEIQKQRVGGAMTTLL